MSNRDRNAAATKRRPSGRPFAKGPDSRRNIHGQRSKAAVQLSKSIRSHLVEEAKRNVHYTVKTPAGDIKMKARNIDLLAKRIWREAVDGDAAFVHIILDRIEGKVTQPIEGELKGNVTFIMPRPGQVVGEDKK